MADVLLDGERQILAGEELVFGNEAMITVPIVGDKRLAFDTDFIEELLASGVITATQSMVRRSIGS